MTNKEKDTQQEIKKKKLAEALRKNLIARKNQKRNRDLLNKENQENK